MLPLSPPRGRVPVTFPATEISLRRRRNESSPVINALARAKRGPDLSLGLPVYGQRFKRFSWAQESRVTLALSLFLSFLSFLADSATLLLSVRSWTTRIRGLLAANDLRARWGLATRLYSQLNLKLGPFSLSLYAFLSPGSFGRVELFISALQTRFAVVACGRS